MEHLSIDDYIRVEEHLAKKLTEACGEFKKLIATKTSNGQPLSRDQFQRFYRLVRSIFKSDCEMLLRFFPNSQQVILHSYCKGFLKIKILHDLEWQVLISQLPQLRMKCTNAPSYLPVISFKILFLLKSIVYITNLFRMFYFVELLSLLNDKSFKYFSFC